MRLFSCTGILALSMLCSAGVYAQKMVPCATDAYFEQHVRKNPALLQAMQQANEIAAEHKNEQGSRASEVYTIPVIFHVIHQGGPENVNKTVIGYQMDILNQTYNKLNKDTGSVRKLFQPLIANINVKFVLASKDPWGNCTDGINRVKSDLTNEATDAVKNLVQWDPKKYLNVWVVKSIFDFQNSGGQTFIGGYASFPWDAISNPDADGIIIDYRFIGFNKKTLTHEVGHYLGLFHTFQDGCAINGDQVDDTPPAAAANFGWNTTLNTCSSDMPNKPDMIENYMDYADYSYMFTTGQMNRMRTMIKSYRSKLVSADNLAYTTQACTNGINAEGAENTTVSVYPNPTKDILNIDLKGISNQQVSIQVLDITGKVRYQETVNPASPNTRHTLQISEAGLSAGVYMLQVTTAGQVYTNKVITQ